MEYRNIFLLIMLLLCTSCGNKIYINDKSYNENDEIILEVNLKTSDTSISVCPVIKISKEKENSINKLKEYIEFSSDNIEFLDLVASNIEESEIDNYFIFKAMLKNGEDNVSFTDGNVIERIKLKIKEKGKYHITLEEAFENSECKLYNEKLTLEIN